MKSKKPKSSPLAPTPSSSGHPFAAAANWDLEQSYESRPRSVKKRRAKENTRLPIKTANGIQQVPNLPAGDAASSSSDSGGDEIDVGSAEGEIAEEKEEEGKGEGKRPPSTVPRGQRLLEAKEELAAVSMSITEYPEENIGLFKRLRELCSDEEPRIRVRALVSQLVVFRGLIPGYRIRPLTEEEMKVKVTKEVRKLRGYEQALVANYQVYVQSLGKLAKAARTDGSRESAATEKVALSCACKLLDSVPHFNFRTELLKMIVERVSVKTVDETFIMCRAALENLFRTDEDGGPSLEAVQLLTKMMKAKHYRIGESVLNTFLSLRLLSELDLKGSQDKVDNPRKRKKDREFRTRKARKLEKGRKATEKEMEEADATVSHEEREQRQSETLKLVFATYFRILKEKPPGLMGATLEGLAKYAHLINLDFFGDLLVALKELIAAAAQEAEADGSSESSERNAVREALLCPPRANTTEGGGMSIDLTFFTSHLYATLLPLSLSPDLELSANSLRLPDPISPHPPQRRVNVSTEIEMLLRALNSVFFSQSHQKSTTPVRLAAFAKRMATSCLNMPEKSTLAVIGLMTKLSTKHKRRLQTLFSTEDVVGDGTYRIEVDEPEISNPFAATIWETALLKNHYSPKVAQAARELPKLFLNRPA